jgi:hypothetical protein
MRVGMNAPDNFKSEKFICLNPKVSERIAWLRKAGTTGSLLADKAETIISRLKSGEPWLTDRKIAPRTLHGEKRIRKCVKYDLGWGFRLITILRRDCLFICYLGPHDECDRWLADNSRLKEVDFGRNALYEFATQELRDEVASPEDSFEAWDDLDKRLQEMPDQSLRRIFCGLVEARKRPLVSKAATFNRPYG